MTIEKLNEQLAQLHAEVDGLYSISNEDKEKLDHLIASIERSAQSSDQNVQQTLTESVARFETSYPRLTSILNEIMVTLSNMGI